MVKPQEKSNSFWVIKMSKLEGFMTGLNIWDFSNQCSIYVLLGTVRFWEKVSITGKIWSASQS